MSYEKHTWVNHEKVTSEKLNSIEAGVEEAVGKAEEADGKAVQVEAKIDGTRYEVHTETITEFPYEADKNAFANWNYEGLKYMNMFINGTKVVDKGVVAEGGYFGTATATGSFSYSDDVSCFASFGFTRNNKNCSFDGLPTLLPATVRIELFYEDSDSVEAKIKTAQKNAEDDKYVILKTFADVGPIDCSDIRQYLTGRAFQNMTVILDGLTVVENGQSKVGGTWGMGDGFSHVGVIDFRIHYRGINWGMGNIASDAYLESEVEIRIPKDKIKPDSGETALDVISTDGSGGIGHDFTLGTMGAAGTPFWADVLHADYFMIVELNSMTAFPVPYVQGGGDGFQSWLEFSLLSAELRAMVMNSNTVPDLDDVIMRIEGTYGPGVPELMIVAGYKQPWEV